MAKNETAVASNESNESALAAALSKFNDAVHAPMTREVGKALAVGAGAALGFMAVTAIHGALAN